MRVLAMVCGLALLSSSCATTKKTETKTVKKIDVVRYFEKPVIGKRTTQQYKDPLEEGMFDPDSSRYRNIKYYSPKLKGKRITVMCGKLNGKNKFGGYIGYKRFVSDGVRSNSDSDYKSDVVDCLCRNGEIALKCQTSTVTVTVTDSGASVGAHCWSWLFFPYGGGWLWLKCY